MTERAAVSLELAECCLDPAIPTQGSRLDFQEMHLSFYFLLMFDLSTKQTVGNAAMLKESNASDREYCFIIKAQINQILI